MHTRENRITVCSPGQGINSNSRISDAPYAESADHDVSIGSTKRRDDGYDRVKLRLSDAGACSSGAFGTPYNPVIAQMIFESNIESLYC